MTHLIKFLWGLLLLWQPIGQVLAATPIITNVSGTVAIGQTLTITGSNFIDANTTGRLIPESQGSFEGANHIADGYDEPGSPYGNIYDGSVKLLGAQSLTSTIFGECDGGPEVNCFGEYLFRYSIPTSNEMYARMYVRFNPAFSTVWATASYAKMLYWIPASVYVQPSIPSPGGLDTMLVKIDAPSTTLNLPATWTTERWYAVEARGNSSAGEAQVWVDGVDIGTYSGTFADVMTDPAIGIINANGIPFSGVFTMWVDGYMLSTQRIYPASTVEVADGSNYSAADKVIQEPFSYADGLSTIKYSEAGHDLSGTQITLSGVDRYMFITNNKQERSTAYLLSGTAAAVPIKFNTAARRMKMGQ